MAVPVLTELGIDLEVLDLINQERAKVGVPQLTKSETIDDASDRHALDMATNNNFSETGTDGSTVASRIQDAGYPFSNVNEAIAFGPATPADVVAQWINDPTQRNILLDPTFTETALGVVANTDGNIYWAETFGGPDVAPAPVTPMTASADPLPVDPMVAVDPTPAPVDPMLAVDPMVAVDPIMTATADPITAPANDPTMNVDITGGVTTVGNPTDLQPSPDPVVEPVVAPNPIIMQMASVPQDTNNSNSDPIYSGQGNHSRRHQSHDRMGAPSDPMGNSDMMSAPSRNMGRHH
ncbi:MAG: hypothetical protein RLZZ135_218 [Cyanobacteriota bacterium]|jgi:hypothetical protein